MEGEDRPARRQSAAVPFRMEGEGLRVLLITASTGERWIIPKGWIEPDLTPWDSAAKEALEEAGVAGEVSADPIGDYEYTKFGSAYTVRVFALKVEEVLEEWPEAFRRRRMWVSLEEAMDLVPDSGLRRILSDLPGLLERRGFGRGGGGEPDRRGAGS